MTGPLDAGTRPRVEQAYAARWQSVIQHDLAWRLEMNALQDGLRRTEPPAVEPPSSSA
jgi:hypothetical protein